MKVSELMKRVVGAGGLEEKPPCRDAEAFWCALQARRGERLWLVCSDVRAQEELAVELAEWHETAIMFPELPRIGEDAESLADPEILAMRLNILSEISGAQASRLCGEGLSPKGLREQNPQPRSTLAQKGTEISPVASNCKPPASSQAGRLCSTSGFTLVLNERQMDEEVPDPQANAATARTLRVGEADEPHELAEWLARFAYEQVPVTAVRGQFSLRGGIVDVFSWQAERPLRIEFDERGIVSIREFDPDTQVSVKKDEEARASVSSENSIESTASTESIESSSTVPSRAAIPHATLMTLSTKRRFVKLSSLVAEGDVVLKLGEAVDTESLNASTYFPLPFGTLAAGDLAMDAVRAEKFFGTLEEWRLGGWLVVLAAGSESEVQRFREFAVERGRDVAWIEHLPLTLAHGFIHEVSKTAVLSDAAIFGRVAMLRARRAGARHFRSSAARAAADFSQFEEGEHVVHLDHGIGLYEGLVAHPDGANEDVLAIRFANNLRLYVPLSQAWQVSRYVGLGKADPALSDLGNERWAKMKQKAVASVFDYAARMLQVHAERQAMPGHAFAPDTEWQVEFEKAFPYRETADQLKAIIATKHDMETPRPMDRLVCGDVGFGKTEVAIRAVFKAVMDGKQVALLAPTTVLAQQHYQTLRERFSDFPVTVELLNRYRSTAQQRRVVEGLASGGVDVVVGTHRLLSPDVRFRDLALVVVDEEQRFGVKHKDVIKDVFRQVDILTLSATPIPRTLYMAMVGARDMSLIETPPPDRQAVETLVCAYDERVWRDAIKRELERGGQVYFLHNRVMTIEKVASRVRELCPTARVDVGHGQMPEGALDDVMKRFVEGRVDVLVSTTIVESGLDIPNANTIVIDRADMFGLADLYQLRGRVGRSSAKAYAYLMLPRTMMGAARKRVSAIKQYSGLGAGFKIAMRDLELRGAGNLLGTAQSGHIMAVGFDLYCRLLKRAVDTLGGKAKFSRMECAVRLDFVRTEEWAAPLDLLEGEEVRAYVPASYVTEASLRIACYRQVAEAETYEALEGVHAEWRDRYGALPPEASHFLTLAAIAIAGAERKISSVEVKEGKVLLTRGRKLIQEQGKFPRLTRKGAIERLGEVLRVVEAH